MRRNSTPAVIWIVPTKVGIETIHERCPMTPDSTRTRDTALVRVETRENIAVVTLRRTAQRNALSMAMCTVLEQAVREAGARARVIILASDGPDFCVGADLVERQALLATGFDDARAASTALTDTVLAS